MHLVRFCLLFSFLLLPWLCRAQTAFQAGWSFEGNANGSSSTGLVAASMATPVGVNYLAVAPFSTGYAGLGANVQNWSTTLCNHTEYVEFTVHPTGGTTITLTALSFYFSRSAQGPQQLSVRSSIDGFSTDLANTAVTTTYQVANVALNNPGFINQSGPITFRIYACNPTAGGGTLKLDEITINGAVLPVELLYVKAQVINDRVELTWATVWERNADRFVVERSRDLREFGALGSITAKGTTDQPQQYTFTDPFPEGGITYYRLKQVDINGATTYSKPIAVILDNQTPALALLGNPVEGIAIRVATRNLTGATYSLITLTGQHIDLLPQPLADGSLQLHFLQIPPSGLHWLHAEQGAWQMTQGILLR